MFFFAHVVMAFFAHVVMAFFAHVVMAFFAHVSGHSFFGRRFALGEGDAPINLPRAVFFREQHAVLAH